MLPSLSSSSTQNPNSFSEFNNQSRHFDSAILSFLSFLDSPSHSINSTFDRVLEKFISSSSYDDQQQLIQRVSLLLETTKRLSRKQATIHNSISWFLPFDLTIKVFSMLDTKSLMQALACCTMFNKCAMEPLCYSHIDLTTTSEHFDDQIVSTMIQRSGKELRSLKFGRVARQYSPTDISTTSCLAPLLSPDRNLLRTIHLYNPSSVDYNSFCDALSSSACSNLTDLKIVGLKGSTEQLLDLFARKCQLLEHLFLENFSYSEEVTTCSTIEALVTNCPNLTSLTLTKFKLITQWTEFLLRLPLEKLKDKRSDVTFVAKFPFDHKFGWFGI